MLRNLYVQNLALISSLSLDFENGFSVLTGETGAGKSLILDSLNLFLQKGSPKELVRRGEKELAVSLFFDGLSPAAKETLSSLAPGADGEEGVTLSRTVTLEGKSVCRIAGRTVSFAALREMALRLIFIHGQNDAAYLFDPKTHLSFLDVSFSPEEKEKKAQYASDFAVYKELLSRLARLKKDDRDPDAAAAYYEYQIREIRGAKLKAGEEEELTQRLSRLRAAEKIHSALSLCDRALSGGEKGRGAAQLLDFAAARMEALAEFDSYRAIAATLRSLSGEVQSAAEEAAALLDEVSEEDPAQEMDRIQSRLDLISRIKSKYGATEEEVLSFLARATAEKEELSTRAERIEALEKQIKEQRAALQEKAAALTEIRREKKKTLEDEVHRVLAFLDMEKCRFEVHLSPLSDFSPDGADEVEFFASTNPGEEAKPLRKIASGGELARVMLALQLKVGREKGVGTLVFDEIDTGISGATSQKIGICLKKLSQNTQILCVTHSAQISSLADAHFKVEKEEKDGRTETKVARLGEKESLEETARILGGHEIGSASLANARALREDGRKEFDKQKDLL